MCRIHCNLAGLIGLRGRRMDSYHVRWTACRVIDDNFKLFRKSMFGRTGFYV
jgi:hypothetical protein